MFLEETLAQRWNKVGGCCSLDPVWESPVDKLLCGGLEDMCVRISYPRSVLRPGRLLWMELWRQWFSWWSLRTILTSTLPVSWAGKEATKWINLDNTGRRKHYKFICFFHVTANENMIHLVFLAYKIDRWRRNYISYLSQSILLWVLFVHTLASQARNVCRFIINQKLVR